MRHLFLLAVLIALLTGCVVGATGLRLLVFGARLAQGNPSRLRRALDRAVALPAITVPTDENARSTLLAGKLACVR